MITTNTAEFDGGMAHFNGFIHSEITKVRATSMDLIQLQLKPDADGETKGRLLMHAAQFDTSFNGLLVIIDKKQSRIVEQLGSQYWPTNSAELNQEMLVLDENVGEINGQIKEIKSVIMDIITVG
ncbi:unnamed protein product [Sympodiomycopsis kandeliae]